MVAQSAAPRVSKDDAARDEEGVLVSEYNKWLIIEEKLESAQETRKSKQQGEKIIRDREERYRARAVQKQQASIEQMKDVKRKVEDCRTQNQKQGKVRAGAAQRVTVCCQLFPLRAHARARAPRRRFVRASWRGGTSGSSWSRVDSSMPAASTRSS